MPELPEVETIVRQLDKVLLGETIKSIKVLREKSFKEGSGRLIDRRIERVGRKQKMIVVYFKKWQSKLIIHLKMTGQLIFVSEKTRVVGGHPTSDWLNELPSKHTRVIIKFEDDSTLYFNDQRVFGWMKIIENEEFKIQNDLLPPDVVDAEFTLQYFINKLKKSSRAIKLVILDQKIVGGMGNIYANDALFLAGINPKSKANELSRRQIGKLREAMIAVILKGIEMGGSSISHFVDSSGIGGQYQKHFLVYGREGEKCKKKGCGGVIKKINLVGRGTYYCPQCQR